MCAGIKLIHVSKRGHWNVAMPFASTLSITVWDVNFFICDKAA